MESDSVPTTSFDHTTREFAADPWSVYEELRRKCPVARTDAHGGFWTIARYDDVFAVARDDETFSSDREVVIPATNIGRLIPLNSDPPDLKRYRSLLLPFFSAKACERLLPSIRGYVNRAIDGFIETGRCDLMQDLATVLPSQTTLEILGLPTEQWRDWAEPLHSLAYTPQTDPRFEVAHRKMIETRDRAFEQIDALAARPGDDLIGHLLQAERRQEVTREEVKALVWMVFLGGFDTTAAALGNILLYLSRNPRARRQLIEDPSGIPKAIEELLRLEPPVQGFARTVKERCVIGEQEIEAGETVFMLWASANRDEAVFERASETLLDRHPNRHLTFGVGGHRCVGSVLARLELRVAVEEVLRRLPDYLIYENRIQQTESVAILYGRLALPARFSPGTKTASS